MRSLSFGSIRHHVFDSFPNGERKKACITFRLSASGSDHFPYERNC